MERLFSCSFCSIDRTRQQRASDNFPTISLLPYRVHDALFDRQAIKSQLDDGRPVHPHPLHQQRNPFCVLLSELDMRRRRFGHSAMIAKDLWALHLHQLTTNSPWRGHMVRMECSCTLLFVRSTLAATLQVISSLVPILLVRQQFALRKAPGYASLAHASAQENVDESPSLHCRRFVCNHRAHRRTHRGRRARPLACDELRLRTNSHLSLQGLPDPPRELADSGSVPQGAEPHA